MIWIIIGGFLIGVGARIAGAWNLGHGLTGIALLNKQSFVAMSLILATAVSTSTWFYSIGLEKFMYFEFKVLDEVFPYVSKFLILLLIFYLLYVEFLVLKNGANLI